MIPSVIKRTQESVENGGEKPRKPLFYKYLKLNSIFNKNGIDVAY